MMATIGIVIDIIVVALVVVFAVLGMKKGFFKTFLSLFSWSVCLLIAIWSAKYVANLLNKIYDFSTLIGNSISNGLKNSNEFFNQAINTYSTSAEWIENIPSDINGLLAQLVKIVFSNSSIDYTSTETVASVVGSSLGYIAMMVISGILVFIVLKIILALLSKLFESIVKIKLLGWLNRILGLVVGLLKAVVIIAIANVLLVILSLVPAVNSTMTELIQNNTYVERFIYQKTNDFVGDYVIEGEAIQNWITNLWNSR